MSYFVPVITIDSADINNHSKMIGVVPTLVMPAEVDRIGFMLQNLNETNDLWWGYDNLVAVGGLGYFCLKAGDKRPFTPPAHGVYRGAIYAISDGGGYLTAKSWIQQ
jgi:hypothetical protein